MTKYQCLSCLGIYNDTTYNYNYFHICPPDTVDPRNENVKPKYLTEEAPAGTDKEIAKGKGHKEVK